MTRLSALAILLWLTAPALAQDNAARVDPAVLDLVPKVLDIVPKVQDLDLVTRDIVATVQDMITVTQTAKQVKIELPADVLFDFDKADIRPDAAVALAAAADL